MEKRTGPNGPAAEEREQALAREIRVKDALIHEVHHRVKNNLQTVESLMRLHIRRCPSEEARNVLVEAAGRLRSMAIAHEMLSEATKEQVDAIELARRVSSRSKLVCAVTQVGFASQLPEPRALFPDPFP